MPAGPRGRLVLLLPDRRESACVANRLPRKHHVEGQLVGPGVKSADRRQQGLAALELLEQAVHRLRDAPAATLATYYVGALPFVLGLLFFWADMSRSAFADQHVAGAALGVAGLFLW